MSKIATSSSQPLELMAKLPKLQRNTILGALFVAILVGYWFTIYGGVGKDIGSLDARLSELHGDLSKSRSIAANLDAFEKKQKELRAELSTALDRLPNRKELPVLLTDISSLGKKSGLEIRSFRPEPEVTHGFYAEVPIRIEFLGSYHEVAVFFDRLSRLSRIVNITELTMAHAGNPQSDSPQLYVKGIATTFRFIDSPGNAGGA